MNNDLDVGQGGGGLSRITPLGLQTFQSCIDSAKLPTRSAIFSAAVAVAKSPRVAASVVPIPRTVRSSDLRRLLERFVRAARRAAMSVVLVAKSPPPPPPERLEDATPKRSASLARVDRKFQSAPPALVPGK